MSSQPQIKRVHVKDLPQIQLHMYREGEEKSSETLFASYVPVDMVKQILKEKGLLNEGYADL